MLPLGIPAGRVARDAYCGSCTVQYLRHKLLCRRKVLLFCSRRSRLSPRSGTKTTAVQKTIVPILSSVPLPKASPDAITNRAATAPMILAGIRSCFFDSFCTVLLVIGIQCSTRLTKVLPASYPAEVPVHQENFAHYRDGVFCECRSSSPSNLVCRIQINGVAPANPVLPARSTELVREVNGG